MLVVIAGSRSTSEADVREAIERCPWAMFVSVVVSGTARGADRHGEQWAAERGLRLELVPADWKRFGRAAGPRRNAEMAEHADGLIAVWDGESAGTKNMIEGALRRGLRVAVYRTDAKSIELTEATGARFLRWEDAEERAGIMEFGADMKRSAAELAAGAEASTMVAADSRASSRPPRKKNAKPALAES